jgi:hypothetical protein
MSWIAENRRREAAHRRQEREERKRQKELERRNKEQAKLSELEQARLEVETHENALDVLLSVHKESSATFDWDAYACALPPHETPRLARHELAAQLQQVLLDIMQPDGATAEALEAARLLDEREHQAARADYEKELARWEKLRSLARRVLAGEASGYYEAVTEFSAFDEISNLGSSIDVRVYGSNLFKCVLKVNGRDILPTEVKTLTVSGKVSTKPTPRARFNEIYQDYVCGCVLRVAREVFALLPIRTILVTATVDGIDPRTGRPIDMPVVSVAVTREVIEHLDFERLDPSDALENFMHRGKVEASRKSGEFVPIEPLTPTDLEEKKPEKMGLAALVTHMREIRRELAAFLKSPTPEALIQTEPTVRPL